VLNFKTIAFLTLAAIGLSACGDASGGSSETTTFIAGQMKSNPSQVRSFIRVGAKECAEKKAGGKLPSYVTKFVGNSVMMGVRQAVRTNGTTLSAEDTKKFNTKVQKKLKPKIKRLKRRLSKEKKDTVKRARSVLSGSFLSGAALGNCVMQSAMKGLQAKAAEKS